MNIRLRELLLFGLLMFSTPFLLGAVIHGAGGGGSVSTWADLIAGGAMGTSESAPFSIRGVGGQATNGRDLYQSSGGVWTDVCVVGGVPNACNYIRQLSATYTFEIRNASAAAIFTVSNDTGALTNVTLDAEATGNALTLPFRWDLDMCGVSPTDGTTTGHVWNRDPLSTAPTLTADVDTNVGRCKLTFPDSDGTYGVQITRQIPDGTLTGNFDMDIWWDTTGTGNARFQVQTKCYASNEADDAAFNTASVVTAAAGTSGRPNKVTATGITVTGCTGGKLMRLRLFRARTEASDTLNAALNIEKVVFKGRVIE